jgi:hypothetical protein
VRSTSDKHDKLWRQWQSRVPAKTRILSELLRAKLIAVVEEAGFAKVDFELDRPDRRVDGNELRFERDSGPYTDVVYAFFDKYDSPRFQVVFSRRMRASPEKILRSGRLTRRPSQRYYEWGKPRWLPAALWSDALAKRCVDEAVRRMPQVIDALEAEDRKPKTADEVT